MSLLREKRRGGKFLPLHLAAWPFRGRPPFSLGTSAKSGLPNASAHAREIHSLALSPRADASAQISKHNSRPNRVHTCLESLDRRTGATLI